MSMYSACPLPFDAPDEEGEAGTSPAVGVGGWAPTPPDDHDGRDGPVRGRRVFSPEAEEWGRVQAERAPRWSAEKRRRVAALLGLVLPEDAPGGMRRAG
jgi:hypothetical protein